jgi:hypothetical protein
VNPDEINERLGSLREAGVGLRARPRSELLDVLGAVLDGWRNPESAWRVGFEAEFPAATGFSGATVREGLDRGLSGWSGAALRALVEGELGPQLGEESRGVAVWGFDTTAVVLGGSIPMPTLASIMAPLLLRSPVLAKAASRDPVTPFWVARSIAEVDPELGNCVGVVEFPGNDTHCTRALLQTECICATGGDGTIAELAAQIRPPRRAVLDGHRLSVAAIGPKPHSDVAERLALDIALWDQLGCLSPVIVYSLGKQRRAQALAERLAMAMEAAEQRWPRGEIDAGAARDVLRERSEAELRAAAGRSVQVFTSESTAWSVVCEDTPDLRPAPLHRFVRVVPIADAAEFRDVLQPLGPHLAAVAVEGFADATESVHRACAQSGASRICAPGQLQSPPLDWRRGGRGVLTSMARISSVDPSV